MLERAPSAWPEEGTVEERWEVMHSAILESADELLGYEKSRQPDWFQESVDELRPQQRRNNAYDIWLASGKEEDLTRFKVARNEVRKSIREAKNSWFRAKAQEAEGEHFGGKKVWKCLRDMQYGRRGRVPTRVVAICDESGEPCSTPTEQHQRWRRHFTMVLNVRSQFDGAELAEVRQRETDAELGTVPTSAELAKALGKLKNGSTWQLQHLTRNAEGWR